MGSIFVICIDLKILAYYQHGTGRPVRHIEVNNKYHSNYTSYRNVLPLVGKLETPASTPSAIRRCDVGSFIDIGLETDRIF